MTEPKLEEPVNQVTPGRLHWAFMEWLRDYEILDTGNWEGLSTEAVDVLCEHYWQKFHAGLEVEAGPQ